MIFFFTFLLINFKDDFEFTKKDLMDKKVVDKVDYIFGGSLVFILLLYGIC